MERIQLTKKQFDKLAQESRDIQEELEQLAKDVARFAAMGDLSENAEYQYAKDRQRYLFSRLEEINDKLSRSVVVQMTEENPEYVGVGTSVKVINLDSEEEEIFNIVGSGEFDFDKREIPASGPIAAALMDCGEGEEVEAETPGGVTRFRIISIERYEGS